MTVTTKSLKIAAAEYGLGAFAVHNIKRGEYIGGNTLPYKKHTAECSTPHQNTWGRFMAPTIIRQERTPQFVSRCRLTESI